MKLLKLADRTVSVLGLVLFGVLTGFSLFLTSYFALTYEEIPRTTGGYFPAGAADLRVSDLCHVPDFWLDA